MNKKKPDLPEPSVEAVRRSRMDAVERLAEKKAAYKKQAAASDMIRLKKPAYKSIPDSIIKKGNK